MLQSPINLDIKDSKYVSLRYCIEEPDTSNLKGSMVTFLDKNITFLSFQDYIVRLVYI